MMTMIMMMMMIIMMMSSLKVTMESVSVNALKVMMTNDKVSSLSTYSNS